MAEENLYIGTSAGEILHHVQIPPDPNDPSGSATFILASRLRPPVNQQNGPGIQQILLLPAVSKACILSNNTLNFYTLPELSPAFPQLKPLTCGWVGGVDINGSEQEQAEIGTVAIMMCLRNKIRLVNIGEQAQKERDIEFGGCLATVRRGNIACVADARSYALVDVVAQQKIPLLSISSLDEQSPEQAGTGTLQDEMWPSAAGIARSSSNAGTQAGRLGVHDRGHGRSTSLGVFRTESPLGDSPRNSLQAGRYGFDAPAFLNRHGSPKPPVSPERRGSVGTKAADDGKPLPPPPAEAMENSQSTTVPKSFVPLRPIIASPSDSEFLLVTGTAPSEPGVGMFVNSDGDVIRGSMEFSSFPEWLVVDGGGQDLSISSSQIDPNGSEEGFVLSVVRRSFDEALSKDIEIQRWDVDPGESSARKEWLNVQAFTSSRAAKDSLGLRQNTEKINISLPSIVDKLALKALLLGTDISQEYEPTIKRENEERAYYTRMAKTTASITVWNGDEVYWAVRNPLVLRLDARLRLAEHSTQVPNAQISPQRAQVETILNELRGYRSQTELEFYTLSYIRQKAAILLFIDLVLQTCSGTIAFEHDKRSTEEALVESELDPRFVLHFLPGISSEILQAQEGIWLQGGIKILVERFLVQHDTVEMSTDTKGPFGDNLLQVIKRFLLVWRRKRGNPSVIDGEHVFPSVDAALLRILLLLDRDTPTGPATAGSIRAELNAVVDSGVECFERAVDMLEQHKRLYVLSRLYQSRKNASMVLATWKRIISGEPDLGGEFMDGEVELKTYLSKLRNRQLVEEYGTWLANRNPKLGVQVFADDNSRTSWTTIDALALLRNKAPAAIKEYLEYLVFARKQSQHINELLSYYLTNVLSALQSSADARSILSQTYETYRALRPPKPTYRRFIEDNAIPEEWWQSRLRLLQLLTSTAAEYDINALQTQLEPYKDELIPEMIVLSSRRGEHATAIELMTNGLGDYDTAITYCLRGGYVSSSSSDFKHKGPTRADQARLFHHLLASFLALSDITQRVERTSELLERFGGWFEVEDVLRLLPDGWSVDIFGGFLVRALAKLVRERNESRVVRALVGSESLRVAVEKVGVVEDGGGVVVTT